MIELQGDRLCFSFPEVHPEAKISVSFQRTLRIPDDGRTYPLPPGLGRFSLKHVDDYNVPGRWLEHGGVMLPMYQSEAMWINFESEYLDQRKTHYPFAIKIAAGKIDALTGEPWSDNLSRRSQNYMVSTKQPWLDGYCVEEGIIRQFVAMPLGAGYTAEEQITGSGEHGGLQIIVYPMDGDIFERRFPEVMRMMSFQTFHDTDYKVECASPDMGLAPGGKMHQEIYRDPFDFGDWARNHGSRCFVHIANSLVWRAITGENPATVPLTAKEYTRHGYPWYDYYDDGSAKIDGAEKLNKLKSIFELGKEKKDMPLPENESVKPKVIKNIKPKNTVREGSF